MITATQVLKRAYLQTLRMIITLRGNPLSFDEAHDKKVAKLEAQAEFLRQLLTELPSEKKL